MMITLDDFRLVLRALSSLDRPDLQDVGMFLQSDNWKYPSGSSNYEWSRFCDDPIAYLTNASDEDAERIFMAVMRKAFRKL